VSNTLDVVSIDASCAGEIDGSATASASGEGPFTFSWYDQGGNLVFTDENVQTSTAEGMPAGSYSVSVANLESECESLTKTVVIDQPEAIFMDLVSYMVPKCNEDADGQLHLNLKEGVTWTITVIKDDQPMNNFLFAGGELDLGNLGVGVYEILAECDCGSEYITINLSDPGVADAMFSGSSIVYLSNDEFASYTNESQNDLETEYIWYMGDGSLQFSEDIETHYYQEEGTYEVVLVANNGRCQDYHMEMVEVVGEAVDVQELDVSGISINYLQGFVEVLIGPDEMIEGLKVDVFSIDGRLVMQKSLTSVQENRILIDVNMLSGAIYTVNVSDKTGNLETRKVFIE
jgi:hypothetical protein